MGALAATALRPTWLRHRPLPAAPSRLVRRRPASVRSFRFDLDEMARKVASGEAFRETWRSANSGFEQLLYESRITAQRLDSRYSISTRFREAFQSASIQARDLDRRLGVGVRLRAFSVDFYRNWPRYRKELNEFLETPLGRTSTTAFFLWFVLSGWFFRILIFSTWFLPLAIPLALGGLGNNLLIQGTCPSCRTQFIGFRNQVIRCQNCRNTVWQSQNSSGKGPFSGNDKDVIDVEINEE